MRFEYLVQYDHFSPEASDDPVTDDAVVAALRKFRDELRGIVVAADSDARVDVVPLPPNRPIAKRILLSTDIGAGTVDESVQRCSRDHHLKAALLTCS